MMENILNDESLSDAKDIMRQIQAYVIEHREERNESFHQADRPNGRFGQVYHHLFQAVEASDKIDVQIHARPVRIPIIGRWLTYARETYHRLVVYYLNRLSSRQIRFNVHTAKALTALVHELDTGRHLTASEAHIARLEKRVTELEGRLAKL
jgi:hypothetical protein